MNARDQRIAEEIVRAVAAGGVTAGTRALAERLVARWDAAPAPRAPAPKKAPIPSVKHHEKARRAEARECEQVGRDVWHSVLMRSLIDHKLRHACEACHEPFLVSRLEPHHLEPGHGNRPDAVEKVMALCSDCHTGGTWSAHRAVRWFAQNKVLPWLHAHGYPVPNRKEYRP